MEQLTLSFAPGISRKHRSLLDCCACGIYQRGLVKVAGEIDMAASNLSTALSGGGREFGVVRLERYIEKFGDLDPVYYLIDRFMKEHKSNNQERLLSRAETLMAEFQNVVKELNRGGA